MAIVTWKTSDTSEVIPHGLSDQPVRKFFMYRPGKAPLPDRAYMGLGAFGGVDVLIEIAEMNIKKHDHKCLTAAQKRSVGLCLQRGVTTFTSQSGERFAPGITALALDILGIDGYCVCDWLSVEIDGIRDTVENHFFARRLARNAPLWPEHSVKFSETEDAVYEELAPSEFIEPELL